MPAGNHRTTINVVQPPDRGMIERSNLPEPPPSLADIPPPVGPPAGMKKSESTAESAYRTLHECAKNGDARRAQILLDMDSQAKEQINKFKLINKFDNYHLTPLHYAARYNHIDVIKLLIDNHADMKSEDMKGLTPLHYASGFKRQSKRQKTNTDDVTIVTQTQLSAINLFISKGADINVRDNDRRTPLHHAVMRGNKVATCELLNTDNLTVMRRNEVATVERLKSGDHAVTRGKEVATGELPNCIVSLEAIDKQRMTALHMAASHNMVEVSKMLIDARANLRCKDNNDSTPLHAAASEGNMDIVHMLFEAEAKLDGLMVKDKDIDGNTCLSLSVKNGHYEVVKLILEKRADVNTSNNIDMYPLHLAAINGDVRIVRLLLKHNARIDVRNNEQATPLHKAAQYNHVDCVKILVDRKADIECKDEENYTPLLLAGVFGHALTVDLLIKMGADVTAVDKNDKTAICLTAKKNQLSALEALLKYEEVKSMINYSDRKGNAPLHVAVMKGYLHIVRALLKNGADLDSTNGRKQTPIHLAAENGQTNIVRELVKQDKNAVNDKDVDGNTALHVAAYNGYVKMAGVLIEMGADIAARNSLMMTPLACASNSGSLETLKVLLEADSPIDTIMKYKLTPLLIASISGCTSHVEILIDKGANVEQRDKFGNNCLDLAIDFNNQETVEAIIKSKYWHEALRNYTIDPNTRCRDTPMRKLIRTMPAVAVSVFNRCMVDNKEQLEESKVENYMEKLQASENEYNVENPEKKKYEVEFNYEFIDDMNSINNWGGKGYIDTGLSSGSLVDDQPYTADSGTFKNNHPLMIMVTSKRGDLLSHPLVSALLRHKWSKFGRPFYYFNFILYAIFLVFMTGYMLSTDAPYGQLADSCNDADTAGFKQNWFARIGKYVIIALAAWNLLLEMPQIYKAKLTYFRWENLIDWITYITALLTVIDFESCQKSTGFRTELQWKVGTVAIFLTWINFVLFMQMFPLFGIYVVMFQRILKTFLQFAMVFVLFIVAFAMAFYSLLQNQPAFGTIWQTLIKTTAMMIGEFDYTDIFIDGHVNYKTVSYIMFVIFMVFMSTVIMNMLVGLAVDNIKEVQERAELTMKAMQVELALDVEIILPDWLRRRFIQESEWIQPNVGVNTFFSKTFGLESYGLTAANINKALHPKLDEIEKVQESQVKLKKSVDKNRKKMKAMMKVLLESQDIRRQDEDFEESEESEESE